MKKDPDLIARMLIRAEMEALKAGGTKEEKQKQLNRICKNCGEYLGKHRKPDSACPITDINISERFNDNQFFVEWKEEN